MSPEPKPAVPSATILLLRDLPGGIEVFMVVRHHQIDFASGALVFPGGKLDESDRDPALRGRCAGEEAFDNESLALRVGAIREAFEECGVLLAGRRGETGLVDPGSVPDYEVARVRVHDDDQSFAPFLEEHDLVLASDRLVPFARWITPEMMPRRYDTHFYLAQCPDNQQARHDDIEATDSVWINPMRALEEAEQGNWMIIFPTRMNLKKLGESATVAEALERARNSPIVTVQPWLEARDGGQVLCIPEQAGYGKIEEPVENLP